LSWSTRGAALAGTFILLLAVGLLARAVRTSPAQTARPV